jgi:hypothetical protein
VKATRSLSSITDLKILTKRTNAAVANRSHLDRLSSAAIDDALQALNREIAVEEKRKASLKNGNKPHISTEMEQAVCEPVEHHWLILG